MIITLGNLMKPEQRQELIEQVCRGIFEVANQEPWNPDALKESANVVDQIVAPLVERVIELQGVIQKMLIPLEYAQKEWENVDTFELEEESPYAEAIEMGRKHKGVERD